jgi:hypothetical protein
MIAIEILAIGSVMHSMMRGGVEYPLERADPADDIGVQPELLEEVDAEHRANGDRVQPECTRPASAPDDPPCHSSRQSPARRRSCRLHSIAAARTSRQAGLSREEPEAVVAGGCALRDTASENRRCKHNSGEHTRCKLHVLHLQVLPARWRTALFLVKSW